MIEFLNAWGGVISSGVVVIIISAAVYAMEHAAPFDIEEHEEDKPFTKRQYERAMYRIEMLMKLDPEKDSDCWEWPKSKCNKGYGKITVAGIARRCHIVMWELTVGRRVRRGYTLDHLCRNKLCFRPTHMEEVTRSENTARGNRANPRSTEHLRKHRDKSIPVADHQQPALRQEGYRVRESGLQEEGATGTAPKQT